MKVVTALLAAALTGAYVLAAQSQRLWWAVAGFIAFAAGFVLVATLAPSLRGGVITGYLVGIAAGALASTVARRRKAAR